MVVSIRSTCGYGETCCRCCCYFWLAVFSSSPFLSSMLGCLPVFVSFSRMKVTKVHKSKHHYKWLRQSTAFSPAFFLQKPLMKIWSTSTSYSKRWPSATNLQHFHPPQQESRGLSVRLSPSGRFFTHIIFSSISVVVSSGETRRNGLSRNYGMKNLGNSASLPRYSTFDLGTRTPAGKAWDRKSANACLWPATIPLPPILHQKSSNQNHPLASHKSHLAKGRCSTQDAYQAPAEARKHNDNDGCYAAMLHIPFQENDA